MISGPPLSALGKIGIEIFGPTSGSGRWGISNWGEATWSVNGWRDVTPQSMTVEVNWGADYPEGVLSSPATGQWTVRTYDPQRVLDPSNGASPYASALRPGNPVRITVRDGATTYIVRTGLIDTVHYDIESQTGILRGTDLLQLVSRARLPANQTSVPNTLRARAAELIKRVNLDSKIVVDSGLKQFLSTNNRSFEAGLGNWTPNGSPAAGSGAVATGDAIDGVNALKVIAGTSFPGYRVPIIGLANGVTYTFGGWVKAGAGAVEYRYLGYNSAGTLTQQANVTSTKTDSTWEYISTTVTVPADGSIVSWVLTARFVASTPTVGDTAYFDLVSFTGPDVNSTDPAVGLIDTAEGSVLDHIAMAARDAQYAFWLDKDGILRFRSFGNPIDNGVQLGGLGGIAMETLTTDASLAGIYTSTTVYDTAAPTVAIKKTDAGGSSIFGEIALLRERPVPAASLWADNLLADRSGASIQYTPGILRIQTIDQLLSLLNLEMVEICTVAVDSAIPPVNLPARALGVKLRADPTAGWSAEVLTYVPANEWEQGDAPIPPEPTPPPNTQQVVRVYNATKDSRAARTSGGSNYGSGTEGELPVGAGSGWRNRAFIDFTGINWSDVQQLVKAEVTLRTSTQVNLAFGSSPKSIFKRITGSWSEGSASSPSGSNALVYPGPSVTDSGSVSKSITRSQSTDVVIDVTAIVKAWAPAAIGGSGQTQRGIAIFSAGEDSTTYTTEFLSREASSGKPVLRITVKIPA
jgi:Carbohydrate binding domain